MSPCSEAGPRPDRTELLILLFAVVACLASACGGPTYRNIKINTKNVKPSRGYVARNKSLNINLLRDKRHGLAKNSLVLHGKREKRDRGEKVCVNAESGYRSGTVARQVTSAIVQHLRKRKSFGAVLLGRNSSADFQLSGDLVMLYGRQKYDIGLAVWTGVGAGLGGALGGAIMGASAKGHAPTTVEIVMANLVIHDRYGNAIARLDDVHVKWKEEMVSDTACWEIYEDVNRKLQKLIAGLAIVIEAAVSGNTSVAGWKRGAGSGGSAISNSALPYQKPIRLRSQAPPPGTPATGTVPAEKRGGCVQVEGDCVSPCNPPCGEGEICLRSGVCVPAS